MSAVATARLMTTEEVAKRLGCSVTTIYRAVDRGELEARRLGENGPLRISEDAFERFLRPANRDGGTR